MDIPNTVTSDHYLIIREFCWNYFMYNYIINADGSIDILNDSKEFIIRHTYLKNLPVKINKVTGNFNISSNYYLTTLENLPKHIGGDIMILQNGKLPLPLQIFLHNNEDNSDKIKTFLRYQNDFEIWTNGFNEDNFNFLLSEIEDGLE